LAKRVTKARNHQNPVQTANFASLDETRSGCVRKSRCSPLLRVPLPAGGTCDRRPRRVISLDEALPALAIPAGRSTLRLLAEERARPGWPTPSQPEYQRLFDAQLTGAALINAVLCSRVIRDLLLSSDLRRPARSQERLVYRHGVHAITAVMMKRLRTKIRAPRADGPSHAPRAASANRSTN
jgi:hypothetical protein